MPTVGMNGMKSNTVALNAEKFCVDTNSRTVAKNAKFSSIGAIMNLRLLSQKQSIGELFENGYLEIMAIMVYYGIYCMRASYCYAMAWNPG